MKTLYQALVDYDIALLKGIAACRAIQLDTASHAEAVRHLTEIMVSPAAIAIALADLSSAEQAALQSVVQQEGVADIKVFMQQHGAIRVMGAARLEREQPWLNPANSAESLWYKGLIFKTFQVNERGGVELIYVPLDLLALLHTQLPVEITTSPKFMVSTTSPPPIIIATTHRLRENGFSLLTTLQNNPIATTHLTTSPTLHDNVLPPLTPTISGELTLLSHLAKEAQLIDAHHEPVTLNRDAARQWLKAESVPADYLLQHTWYHSRTWNDLWRVPSLKAQPTGWENNPLECRRKLLDYLADLPDEWVSVETFIATLKQVEPDFQRPQKDYDSWYIQNEQGDFLMGYENWDNVDGALLRYLLTQILPWLSLVDLGLASPKGPVVSFRVTESGRRFITYRTLEAMKAVYQPPQAGPRATVGRNFKVTISHQTNLYDRFQLARFAAFNRREGKQISYYLTPRTLSQALKQGVTIDQIIGFLQRITATQPSPKLETTLRHWANRWGTVRLERVMLLHVTDEAMVEDLRQHSGLRRKLNRSIDARTIAIPANEASAVEQVLTELGYVS